MTAFNIEDRIEAYLEEEEAFPLETTLRKHFGDLAPRLTAEELEAKIHAVVVNKRENENWGNAIRREFSTVACGDGVDWKERAEAAEREIAAAAKTMNLANVTPLCRVCGLPIGNPACTACGSGGPATIETLCQNFASEFQDWLNLPDRNRANETLQSVARIILHRVASRLDLAPRLTPKELEAKIDAVTREWDKYNTSFADVRSAIRREFSTVACGNGVDWKAKYQSAKEELEESEHARHLQIEELASVHSEIEAAERERDELRAWKSSKQCHLSPQEAREHRRKIEAERDALAERVKELEDDLRKNGGYDVRKMMGEQLERAERAERNILALVDIIADMEARNG